MKTFAELTEGVKTFEDVLAKKGDKSEDILPYATPINSRQHAANDRAILDYIAEYLQDGYVADYSDWDEYKYYPWFRFNKSESAFGFAGSLCGDADSNATVGSRLVFPTEEVSDFYGTQFIEIHNRLLLNKY